MFCRGKIRMNTKKEKAFAYVVTGIYLLFLCWLVLFKLADSIDKIPSISLRPSIQYKIPSNGSII